ncbi:MAG: type secretion system tip protein VgrG, partial [Burkholderia sp.]|nr:type secretion system tip protein VgrG [Burkholderia sp.]
MQSAYTPDAPAETTLGGLTGQGRQAFLQSLSQHARLISIETPLDAGALIVENFSGREALSGLFRFDVDCFSTSAHYELKALAGEEVTLRLLLADGNTRSFHGMVIVAQQLGSDGALARYRLTLAPWLQALAMRRDSYVFQDKTVLEIIEEVFNDYPIASYRFDVKAAMPKRSLTIQYRETDYEFIARLLAEEGLNFFLEHEDDHGSQEAAPRNRSRAAATEAKNAHARHMFVVFDDNASLAVGSQQSVRFHRASATESSDTITNFTKRLQVQAGAVTLGNWDYKTLTAASAESSVQSKATDAPKLEIYEGAGAYRYTDSAESERIVRARVESLAMQQQAVHAESSVRALAVGTWFRLTDHPDCASGAENAHQYIVTSVEHRGSNNLSGQITKLANRDDIEPGTYRNHFTCTPRSTPVRPTYWFPKPTVPGSQVALVVGIANEEITTERDHRVKVQFPWQRGDQPASGQQNHPSTSNAPGNETAGTWVRVAETSAGANWGSHFIPRIGHEVLIDFIAGDIDRPVITGQLYNGADAPAFHGGDNHRGALAGIRSKEYAAGGFNQWVMDDTPDQLRQSFASSCSASQLNIGYLIRQNGNARGAYRGNGFELATDAWSSLRARRGIFLSTAQRNDAVSTQLDTGEAQEKFDAAAETAKALSDSAVQHQALPLSTHQGIQQMMKAIAGTEVADGQRAPKFEQPLALIDSQAGISTATPASTVMLAGQDITMTAASAMRLTGGQGLSLAVARTASLFTHAGGAKVIAAKEPLSVHAHSGPMDVVADKAMTITSSNGNIKVQAKQEILLASGGGYIKLAGSNIDIHCPSAVSVKGVQHGFRGAGSKAAELPLLPDEAAKLNNWIAINYRDAVGDPMADVGYKIRFDSGAVIAGKLDSNGHAHHENVPESAATVEYEQRTPKPDAPWESLQ